MDDVRLAVMMLDGLELQGRTNIVALGITTEGVSSSGCAARASPCSGRRRSNSSSDFASRRRSWSTPACSPKSSDGRLARPRRNTEVVAVVEPAHRRWVLRAVAALVGWFEYCAGDATPMDELVVRLELPPAADETGGATGVS
jgi:hypothetical protein